MGHTLTCHCGAIRFHVDAELDAVTQCNCSTCRRFGAWHWYVPASSVKLETESVALSGYNWRHLHEGHHFCGTCGTSIMRTGYPDGTIAVNACCIDGVDIFGLDVRRFDGHNKIPPGPAR